MTGLIVGVVASLFYLFGVASAFHVLLNAKRAQSTTAWLLALLFIPFFAVPCYWAFGRNKHYGYIEALQKFNDGISSASEQQPYAPAENAGSPLGEADDERIRTELRAFECLANSGFRAGNEISLLINGDAAYTSVFDNIDAAQKYVLVQFYIVRSDKIGNALKDKLIAARERDVAVYFLYDYIGSFSLAADFVDELLSAGVFVSEFSGRRSLFGRFRLNFRNHRKIVVVDGNVGFTGGFNVGDEYLGRDEEIGNWRDTHVRIDGPAVADLQLYFAKDWFFATDSLIEQLDWAPASNRQGADALIIGTGPHDGLRHCGLLFAHLINSAEQRVWIATPYLVPDGHVLGALQLAAMRGVDVRVIVPRSTDSRLFKYVPFAFIDTVLQAGGRVFFYESGFMHQKVILVDDCYALVSTANCDNRSFFLNFEVSTVVRNKEFCGEVEEMLQSDLGASTEITSELIEDRSVLQRLATQVTRLLAPIL